MAREQAERRLVAIMFTDVVGFTAMMAESEERGLRVRERHRTLVGPLVRRYGGEALEIRGDECLSVFASALDAVNCALVSHSEDGIGHVIAGQFDRYRDYAEWWERTKSENWNPEFVEWVEEQRSKAA